MGKSFHKIREDFEKNSSSLKDRKKKLPGLHSAADSFSTIDSLDSLEPVQNQFWIKNKLLNITVDPPEKTKIVANYQNSDKNSKNRNSPRNFLLQK